MCVYSRERKVTKSFCTQVFGSIVAAIHWPYQELSISVPDRAGAQLGLVRRGLDRVQATEEIKFLIAALEPTDLKMLAHVRDLEDDERVLQLRVTAPITRRS